MPKQNPYKNPFIIKDKEPKTFIIRDEKEGFAAASEALHKTLMSEGHMRVATENLARVLKEAIECCKNDGAGMARIRAEGSSDFVESYMWHSFEAYDIVGLLKELEKVRPKNKKFTKEHTK